MDIENNISQFQKILDEKVNSWNTEFNVTCEFSTSSKNILEKVLAMQKSSETIKFGSWSIFECEACKEHSEETPYHVQIDKTFTATEIAVIQRENYKLQTVVDKFNINENISIPIETLKDLIKTVECLSENPSEIDVYSESTCLLDDHIAHVKTMKTVI